MEKFNDIINNLRDRFTNPLFFSFAFSWIFSNWEIIISLLWFDKSQIYHEGYMSIFDFIRAHLSFWYSFFIPFILAIIYTIFNPFIRNWIKVFYTMQNAKGESKSLKATEGNYVSIEKWIGQRNIIEQQHKELSGLIKDEGEIQKENNTLKINNQNLEIRIRNLERESGDLSERINSMYNTNILNGKWTLTYKVPGQEPAKLEIEIINKTIQRIDKFNQKSFVGDIVNFYYDPKLRRIFFIKKIDDPKVDPRKYLINDLSFEDNNKLIGKEDFDIDVEYTRKTFSPATVEFQN